MPEPDTALIQGFLEGDPACSQQIDVWILEVLRHPALRLGSEAQDLAQEVRRKLWVALRAGRFQGTASLRTYTWRVAQHAAIDLLRSRRAKPALLAMDGVADPVDNEASPERALILQERREIFQRVLGRLGAECQKLFQLIAFDELSYKEIARRLQVTEGAIKVRAHRCREKAVAEYRAVTSIEEERPLKVSKPEIE